MHRLTSFVCLGWFRFVGQDHLFAQSLSSMMACWTTGMLTGMLATLSLLFVLVRHVVGPR